MTGRPAPRRRALPAALLALAAVLLACALPDRPAHAQTAQKVPHGASIIPSGISGGQSFRLLFVTSTTTAATSTSISTYNTFVQGRAATNANLKNAAGASFSGEFRAIVSTSTTDARDNTATTGTGVPIYWLGGAKVADNYGDFYDGSWDSVAYKFESGSSTTRTRLEVFTGSNTDGTKHSFPAGAATVNFGRLVVFQGQPIRPLSIGGGAKNASSSSALYGLSPVLTVVPATPAGLAATGGAGQVTLRWNNPNDSSITKYQVTYRKQSESGATTWSDISGSGATTTSHTVTGLDNGVRYLFWLRAVNAGGVGHHAGPAGADTSDTTGPTVSTIAVTSNPPSGQGGYYKAGDDIAVTLTFDEGIVVTGTPALEITVGSAAKSASCARKGATGDDAKKLVCTYRVISGDAETNGISVAANKLTLPSSAAIKDSSTNDATRTHAAVTTQSGHKVDAVAPAAPRGFTASAEVGQVRLTWSAPSPADASIAKWQVRQKTTGSYGSWSDVAGGASARARTVTGLMSGTAYTFQLRAVDTATNAGATATAGPATPTAGVSTAPVGQTVAADWSLIPKDSMNAPVFTAGQRFRLLFVTAADMRALTSTSISTYNGFVQNAASNNAALRPFRSQFRALVSTSAVDARDNTATTGTGVPIYWVGGAKAADNYADFYDGSWDSGPGTTETGGTRRACCGVWTGSNNDGTKHTTQHLGNSRGSYRLGSRRSTDSAPLSALTGSTGIFNLPLYALSPVLTVAGGTTTDTTRPTVTAGSTGYYSDAALSNALTAPQKAGANIYTKVTFSEDMKHVASNAATARPELFHRIGRTDTRYDIVAPGATLASGDCKPNHTTRTNVYVCRYTVGSSVNGAFVVKAGTSSVDKANNALASAYTHAAALTLDTTDPGIAFPSGVTPKVGTASTIALTDSGSKVAKHGAIAVAGTETNASDCNTATKVGNANLTTLATPSASESFMYTPPSGSAGKKVCVYAEDAAGNSNAELWGTAIAAAATTTPAIWSATLTVGGSFDIRGCWQGGGIGACASKLTDDDFTYGGTNYTVSRLYWRRTTNDVILGLTGLSGSQVKTALGSLTLTVDGTALAVSGSTASSAFIRLSYDPSPDWTAGRTVSLTLTGPAALTAPAAPTGLTAAKDGANAIDLSWTAPATASGRAAVTGYEIEWSADGSTGWTALTTISTASTTTYKDSGLAASTTRHYRVRANSSAGAGTWSSTASATTDAAASGITIEFPSTGPRTGGTYTITLKDPTSKIAWYGAIAVPGTTTDASVCDHSNKILDKRGEDGTIMPTMVNPPRAEVSFDYPTPLGLAGMKACVYAFNGARVSHSRLSPVIPIPPGITDIAITSEAGSDRIYTRGETVEITMTFSKTVTVTQGSQPPRIRLSLAQSTTWWWADYVSGSGTTKLVFSHTLTVEDGNPLTVEANYGQFFELRGGTIRDSDGNDADLEHEGLVYALVSIFKTTPVPEGVKLTWEDPEDGTVTGWEYRQRLQGVTGPWTTIPGGADTRAHTVTGLGARTIYAFQMRPVRGAAKGELMIGSAGGLWQQAVPLAAPPPAGLTVPWDWKGIPAGPDGGPRFKDGDSFRLLFVTVGERDATSPNIGEYNRFVQAEAPIAGARALISTEGVEARDNTATAGTGGVAIWWLGGDKVADDYADFWDGSWDSRAGRSAHGDERSSAMVWTGSISNGRYALSKAAGEAQVQWGWLARAGKAVSFGYRGAQVRLSLYGLTPVITVKGAQPAPGPKAIGVQQGQAADSLAVSWKEVEVEGFTCDYRVEWKESCTGEEARCAWSAERRITVPGLGPNKATIGELTQGTSYDVRVRRSGGSRYAPWFPVGEKTFALPAAQQAPAVTAPVLESARVNGADLALRFDAPLDESSAPAGSAFAVSVAGAARTVSAVSVSQDLATLTLASAVASGESVTVGYTPPSTGKLRRAGGGDVAAFSGQAVTNDTPAAQPQLQAPLPALTASVSSAPSEHQGTGLFVVRIAFSEAVTAKAKDAGVQVSGGTLSRAVRVKKRKDLWELRIEPAGNGAVTVTLPAATDCAAAGAICTADGRKLETALTHTVPGPVALSVADARAKEGEDAAIDFAVTLSRAASGEVTVRYVTKNGSAKAGRDFTKAKGRLTFAAGETAKTVSVALLDDAKDEGEETFRLVLKSATGAIIADGEAVGTIENDDPMPAAWLARFGRTVAGQAVDAVTGRLEGGGGSHLTLGGQQVSLDSPEGQAQAAAEIEAVAAALGADTPGGGFDRDGWIRGGDRDERAGSSSYTMTGRELLLGSAFHLQSGGEAGGPAFAAWGRVAHGSFDGAEDGVTMNGEVTTGFLGADVAGERWLAGAAVAVSRGEGTFTLAGDSARESAFDKGEVETTLTSVLPYARFDLNERVTAWGMAGYGTGELTLTEKGEAESERHRADLTMTLGAVGGRGTLVPAPEGGGFALALRTDAFWVRTESDATEGMAAAKGDATRLRLILDASRPVALGAGTLTPSLEAGLRHDGGDAETGTGIELGAGLGWTDPASGVSAELRARWLAAHEASGYEEWGVSGSVRVDPGERGRGLSLTLVPTVGNAGSGTGNLWSAADARGLAPGGEFEAGRRLDAELGYGMALFGGFTGTPNVGLGLSDTARNVRIGWRLTPPAGGVGFELNLDAIRQEVVDDAEPDNGVMLRSVARW